MSNTGGNVDRGIMTQDAAPRARDRRAVPLIVLLALVALAAAVVEIANPGWTVAIVAIAAAVALVVVAAWWLGATTAESSEPAAPAAVDMGEDAPNTDLIAAVSHDLRTPLATIGAYVELLEAGDGGELSGDAKQMLGVVEENVRRAYAIADDLVELRTTDSGRREPVDMGSVVDAAVRAIAPTARERGLRLTIDTELDGARVAGNAVQLERVLGNLLSNAVKFTPEGGTVTVHARVEDADVVVGVTDTGAGISSDDHGKIFERYYRADSARAERVPGSGLGLAIVRELTAEHGGSVQVRSKRGEGATFTLRLPRLAAAAA